MQLNKETIPVFTVFIHGFFFKGFEILCHIHHLRIIYVPTSSTDAILHQTVIVCACAVGHLQFCTRDTCRRERDFSAHWIHSKISAKLLSFLFCLVNHVCKQGEELDGVHKHLHLNCYTRWYFYLVAAMFVHPTFVHNLYTYALFVYIVLFLCRVRVKNARQTQEKKNVKYMKESGLPRFKEAILNGYLYIWMKEEFCKDVPELNNRV